MLTDEGFSVAIAITGEEAMEMLDAEREGYSAVITYVNLPGKFSGWEVARHAREMREKLPIIYMSGASVHEWASKGVPHSRLLPKPFAVAQVVTAGAQLIDSVASST